MSNWDVKTIKERIDPYEFYLKEQELLSFSCKSGSWALAGRCPYHDDRKEGSFKVNLETGAFKCWSCGASGGDIIAFLQQRDNMSFVEVLQKLSKEWRVD